MPSFQKSLALSLAAFIASSAVAQEHVRFTGNTSAGGKLIHDAFQNIAFYVRESLKCQTIEQVVAEILPDGAVRRDAAEPEGMAPATFEIWTVTFCGKAQPFLVVFWEAKEGGTMYRIQLQPGTAPTSPAS